MSKNILTVLAESLRQMHYNHEPLSWGQLAGAVDSAIKTTPEGVQDTTDDPYAAAYLKTVGHVQMLHEAVFGKKFVFSHSDTVREALERIGEKFAEVSTVKVDEDKLAELVSENERLKADLETNCGEISKLRSEIYKVEMKTINMLRKFDIREASQGWEGNLSMLTLRHETAVADLKFYNGSITIDRDALKRQNERLTEQVVELEKGERAIVKIQEQLMTLFPDYSTAEDCDPLQILPKVCEKINNLTKQVADLNEALNGYRNPWLSPGDVVILKVDIQAHNRLVIYASKGEEATVLNYDAARKQASLRTVRGSHILVDQHLFDKKA